MSHDLATRQHIDVHYAWHQFKKGIQTCAPALEIIGALAMFAGGGLGLGGVKEGIYPLLSGGAVFLLGLYGDFSERHNHNDCNTCRLGKGNASQTDTNPPPYNEPSAPPQGE